MASTSATCKQEKCERADDGGKGYCTRHYNAWRRGKLAKPRYKTCRVEGCRKPVARRGRCEEHFARDYPGKKKAEGAAAGEATAPVVEATSE
jgi:hypothetical protein